MFLQQCAELTLERNRLVAVFLRKMEYFDRVLFLTANLVYQFDDAILNRIHLTMKYEKLNKEIRKTVITRFLERINNGRELSNIGTKYMDCFACLLLNGRQVSRRCERRDFWLTSGDLQIKNTIAIATALTTSKGDIFSSSHISRALEANGNFIPASCDTAGDDSLCE